MKNLNYHEQIELTGDIKRIALSPQLLTLTKTVVEESSQYNRHEQGGFFGGVVQQDGTLLLWDNRQTASGEDGKCIIYDKKGGASELDSDFYIRRKKAIPAFSTVRYHSHPRVSMKTLVDELGSEAERIIRFVQGEYEAGIYSFLGIGNLDDALNETLSRHLSAQDLAQSTGRYHLLISPTIYPGREFSHINFYDLSNGKLIPVQLATKRELAQFIKIEERVRNEWKRANFGHEDFDQLSPEQLDEAFGKIYGFTGVIKL